MKIRLWTGAAVIALAQGLALNAHAEDAATAAADKAPIEEIVVLGRGEARQVQTVPGEELSLQTPGASPLKLVDKLPNVNLQTADVFGAYEWGARIAIRSFSRDRLGFTLDKAPLGDMSYGAHNGLHISRAITGENIASAELAQGAGGLDGASSSNLGGVLKFRSRDPADVFGGLVSATVGSDQTFRGFLRLESGELPSGARSYLSYSYTTSDKFRMGGGDHTLDQINFKIVQPVGEGRITAYLDWSERREDDYQDFTLEMYRRLGPHWDNISGNWPLMVQVAEIANNRGDTGVTPRFPQFGTTFPIPFVSIDDAYSGSSGLRDDKLAIVTADFPIGEVFDISVTGYGHKNRGQGQWWTPYVASPNYGVPGATKDDAPISIRTTDYWIERAGIVADASLTLGRHTVSGGLWYEGNDFTQARQFFSLSRDAPGRSSHSFARNPFFTQWKYDFDTTTWKLYLQDVWAVTERLSVNAGFKSLSVENEVRTVVGPDLRASIKAEDNFLPEAGVRFEINDDNEVFAGYAENLRAFQSAQGALFTGVTADFNVVKSRLKPETSKTFEAGWRFRTGSFQGLIAAYHVSFKDRLASVGVGPAIVGNPSRLANVGDVSAKGLEAALDWRIADGWSFFGSYAYNDSTYDDDIRDGSGALIARTKGKTTVDTPKHIAKLELGYDKDGLFGNFSLAYNTKRYFSFENDASVPSQVVANLTLGYRFSGTPFLDGLEAQINITNLFNEEYFSTIDSNGFSLRGDTQSLLNAPPRQVFVTVRKAF